MFEGLKDLFKTKDNKPLTISAILGQDDCSRVLIRFSEHNLKNSRGLVIISLNLVGSIDVHSSQNFDNLQAAGLVSHALNLISGRGD